MDYDVLQKDLCLLGNSFVAESITSFKDKLAFASQADDIYLFQADCLDLLDKIAAKYPNGCFDMIFADPPYFLSNGGITCQSGKVSTVNKGDWDRSRGTEFNHAFNMQWLEKCQRVLKANGTIWVSGTMHSIYSVGFAMQKLGFKLLNDVIWQKPNPPPNLSCRYFTHASETLIWAAKNSQSRHVFNYEAMKEMNNHKQMQSVWSFSPPHISEKQFGKHPTQKPVSLVERCILAATDKRAFIFDPFAGSSTTGVAAIQTKRGFCGVELESEFIQLSTKRLQLALNKRSRI